MGTKVKKSKNKSRKDPLLPTTRQNVGTTDGSGRCGACGRFILLLLPIIACACVLGTLYLLLYKLDVQITDTSISNCMADYDPKVEVLVMTYTSAAMMFIVTAMRNIQINVYHRRQKSESTSMRAINLIAAVANIASYVGFSILATYDIDGPGQSKTIHLIGASMFFGLKGLYEVMHVFLLCKQTQYPLFVKILFTLVPTVSIACSIIFAINKEENTAFEWIAAALGAVYGGLFSILFLVDPVDDELMYFFCCRRGTKGRESTKALA